MFQPILDSMVASLISLIGYEWGSAEFYTVVGVTLFTVLVSNCLLADLFGSKRGFVLGSFAVLLPVVLGLIAHAATELYVVQGTAAQSSGSDAPLIVCGVVAFASVVLLTKHLHGLNVVFRVVVFSMSWALAAGALTSSDVIIEFLDKSGVQLEQREEPEIAES